MDGYGKMKAAIAKTVKEEKEWDALDRMPLSQRLKLMSVNLRRRPVKSSSSSTSTHGAKHVLKSAVKKEDEQCDSQDNPSNFSSVLMDDKISQSAGILKGQPYPTQMKRNYSRELHKKRKISSPLSDLVHAKVEPVDNNIVDATVKNEMGSFPDSSMVLVKSKLGITYVFSEDELDNMVLSERMKLYSLKTAPSSKTGRGVDCSSEMVSVVPDSTPILSVPAKPLKILPPRKRSKTATDSVQIAMEEDAPGLLKLLLEKGVSVDEFKLYGKNESDEPLDNLSSEDSFSELQAVISKEKEEKKKNGHSGKKEEEKKERKKES